MSVMDDTLADESGIPFLSSADDIPVHSTPIKGDKIPLPSTKNALKHFMGQRDRHHDYSEVDSLMSIRLSDVHQNAKGLDSARKGQGRINGGFVPRDFPEGEEYEGTTSRTQQDRNTPDLSHLDNLRPKMKEHPAEKAFHHERSRSPKPIQRSRSPKPSQRSSVRQQNDIFKKPSVPDENNAYKRSNIAEQNDFSKRTQDTLTSTRPYGYSERVPHFSSSYKTNKRYENERNSNDGRANRVNDIDRNGLHAASLGISNSSKEQTKLSIEINTRRYESIDQVDINDERSTERSARLGNIQSDQADRKTVLKDNNSIESGSSSNERKKVTINSPRYTNTQGASVNRSLSKQNTSLSELENTTLQKQRHEIQLLMTELKDRDRELSDMMKSHQQQLVAWQQDRDRLGMLERKCTQYEDELRAKTNQLRSTLTNLKALKSTEIEHRQEVTDLKSTIERLNTENTSLKEDRDQLQIKNTSLQENLTGLLTKVGRLEAREEELRTSVRLKEKDISSATGHMREMSERLQQLDLRSKECQDREKDALKDKEEWKKKFEQSREDFHTLTGEVDRKRKDVVRLSEENKSARQQLALLGKEACMMEKCKDELIDSMRVKQERTDTQLRNLRELYDRQVQEVASLQMQLDSSKELIYRQQNSIDEQQLSNSYQGRGSHASEYSLERSSASQKYSWQRHKSSPTSKTRESDTTSSHHHTQSSGYQSQLYENQSAPGIAGTQVPTNSGNYATSPGSQRQNSNLGYQSQRHENQSTSGVSGYQSQRHDNQSTSGVPGYQSQRHENQSTSGVAGYQSQRHENQSTSGVSGYQSQRHDNQSTSDVAGNQAPASSGKNYASLTGFHHQTSNSMYQSKLYGNQSGPVADTQLTAQLQSNDTPSVGPRPEEIPLYSQNHERTETSRNASAKYGTGSESYTNRGNNSNRAEYQHTERRLNSPKSENQSVPNHTLSSNRYEPTENQDKHFSAYDKNDDNRAGREHSDINKTNEEQSTQLADESSFHTPPHLRKKFNFDSPDRKDGFVIEQTQLKVLTVSPIKDEDRNPGSENRETVPTEHQGNNTGTQGHTLSYQDQGHSNQGQGHSNQAQCHSVELGHSSQVQGPYNQVQSHSYQTQGPSNQVQGHSEIQGHSGNIYGASAMSRELKGDNLQNTEHVIDTIHRGTSAVNAEEFEKRYTFENKLTSFLEELDDIGDDSIWDDIPKHSFNLSLPESSPANKLHKLLIESQEMIHSLERTAESPRQIKIREQKCDTEKQQEVPANNDEINQHKATQ